jgi:hypothetical protein
MAPQGCHTVNSGPPAGLRVRQGARGALTAADFRKAAEADGFTGNITVGTDLASLRRPAKQARTRGIAISARR